MRFLKTADARFDAIILNVPDPQTARLNRFYTAEFFGLARDHLAQGGLLALELRSSEESMSPDLGEFLRCIQRTLREVFPYVVVIPGETIHFFAAARPDVLTDDPKTLISRLEERHLQTRYVREYFIPFRMTPDRMAQVEEQLRPLASTPVNRDFAPVAYYFNGMLWSTQFRSGYSDWFRAAAHVSFRVIVGAVLIVMLLAALLQTAVSGRAKSGRVAAVFCAGATGFTLMALQVLILLAFQSVYGYVYHQLTILIGLCMAGIALGSWLAIRGVGWGNGNSLRSMTATQLLLAVSAPALMIAVTPAGCGFRDEVNMVFCAVGVPGIGGSFRNAGRLSISDCGGSLFWGAK